MDIHPSAIVSSKVKFGKNIKVGAYAIIQDDVEIGDDCIIEEHAKICSGAIIENNCRICSFTTIAGDPQDIHFDTSIKSNVRICENTTVREGATIHRASVQQGYTLIGKNCYLMANSHVGHDCNVGESTIIAPFSCLGGFAEIGRDVFISGNVSVHQKLRIGDGVMLSGNSSFSLDVPPYVNAYRRNMLAGLNLIGLNRRGVSRESIKNIKELYTFVYKDIRLKANAKEALESGMATTKEGLIFIKFFLVEGRNFAKLRNK